MIENDSSIPGIIFSAAIFVAIMTIELLGLAAASKLFDDVFSFAGLNSLPLLISLVLTAWIVTLASYFFYCTRVDYIDVENQTDPAVSASTDKYEIYLPSDVAYKFMIFALIALSSADGKLDAEKIVWIEALQDQFNNLFPERSRLKISKVALLKIAIATSRHGPHHIINTLLDARNKMNTAEKESLIKFCFLISTFNGPISENEASLILDIARAIGLPKSRILEL